MWFHRDKPAESHYIHVISGKINGTQIITKKSGTGTKTKNDGKRDKWKMIWRWSNEINAGNTMLLRSLRQQHHYWLSYFIHQLLSEKCPQSISLHSSGHSLVRSEQMLFAWAIVPSVLGLEITTAVCNRMVVCHNRPDRRQPSRHFCMDSACLVNQASFASVHSPL